MANRKCDSTANKRVGNKRATKKTECSTEKAKSRTSAKKTSRTQNSN